MSFYFFFSSRRRHTRCSRDWSSDVCSSDLKFLRELAFLRENLNPITAAVTDVNKSIHGDIDADHRSPELFVGSVRIMCGSPSVGDLTQRHSVCTPSTFESSCVGVVHNDAPVHITISDVDLMRSVIHEEFRRPAKNTRVLVVHRSVRGMS